MDISADIEAFEEMKAVKKQLENVQKEVRIIGRKNEDNNKKLPEYSGINGLMHRKKRMFLENENIRWRYFFRDKSEELEKVVHVAGYWTVAGFMKAYRKAETVVEDYMQGRKDSNSERKKSVLEELIRIKKEQRDMGVVMSRNEKEYHVAEIIMRCFVSVFNRKGIF